MRGARTLPEPRLLGPIGLAAGTHRDPHFDPDFARVAAGRLCQPAQFVEHVERALVWRISIRHPAVAPFGDALQCPFVMAAIPHRYAARSRARVDASIIDRVPAALERDVRLRPQRLHDLHLLLGAAAAIVEILVQPDKLDLVPSDPDLEAKAT